MIDGYYIALGFRLFLVYSVLLFMLSFMWRLFVNLWDLLFMFLGGIKNHNFKKHNLIDDIDKHEAN